MAKKSSSKYGPEFLSPLDTPKPGKDPGPPVANPPVATPKDPLGFVPGGSHKGKR